MPDRTSRHWWERTAIRLPLLLVLLVGVALYGVPKIIHNATASGGSVCPVAPVTLRLPDSRFRTMLQVSGLESLMANGKADTQGWQWPSAAWSDSPPSDVAVGDSALVDAGYELRWWSAAPDHDLATLFVFPSPAVAHRYVREASSPGCHAQAIAYPVPRPPGARALAWTNPDQAQEADVFFARGATVYRIGVVPGAALSRRRQVDLAERVACKLVAAACSGG